MHVELGELEGKDRRPLLAARGERREVAAVELEHEVVAVRPDERRAVPDLLLGRLREPPGERVPGRLAGEWRGVRHVAERQPAGRRLVGGDLGVGRGERTGQHLEQPAPLGDDRAAGIEERAVPEPQLGP